MKNLRFWKRRKRRKKQRKRGENSDWNRKKSEMKRIFSSSKSGREIGAKSGNSGGNVRIGKGSWERIPWLDHLIPRTGTPSTIPGGILECSSSRCRGQRHSQRMETWRTPGASLSCQNPSGFVGNRERGEGRGWSFGRWRSCPD